MKRIYNIFVQLFVLEKLDNYNSLKVFELAKGIYKTKTRDEIKTTGYVIDSLEAALWSFYTTDTYKDGMKKLVTMGKDVDTVCCIYGQIAGAYYGYSSIPQHWLYSLQKSILIDYIVENFLHKLKLPPSEQLFKLF